MTKATVKSSGMGKAIGSIEKHSLCKDTPNEAAIKERVQLIKDTWNAKVKAQKIVSDGSIPAEAPKRPPEAASTPPVAKKAKTTSEDTKKSSFSSLLKKVSGPSKVVAESPKAEAMNGTSAMVSQMPNGGGNSPKGRV